MQTSPVEIRRKNVDSSTNRKQNAANPAKVSDVKRTNALLRKLKEYKSENQESILADVTSLNLKRYVSECTSAIVCSLLEGKAKISDVEFLGVVCSELHQCYDDVEREILTLIRRKWDIQSSSSDPSEGVREVAKHRAMIRFLCEIYRIGITAEWRIFRWFLQRILAMCPEIPTATGGQPSVGVSTVMSVEKATVVLGYVTILVRSAGGCLFHALPWPADAVEPSISSIAQPHMYEFAASASVADEIGSLIVKFIDIGLATLELENQQLKAVWINNMKAIQKIGDLPESLLDQFGSQKNSCETLYALLYPLVETFPDALRHFSGRQLRIQKVPSLEELFRQNEKNAALKEMSASVVQLSGLSSFYSADCETNEVNVYDSVAEQQFYEAVGQVAFNAEELMKECAEGKDSFALTEEEAVKNIDAHISTIGKASVESIDEEDSCRFDRVKASAVAWTEKFLGKELSLFKYRSRGDRDQGRSFLLSAKKKLYRHIRDAVWSTEIDVVEINYVLVLLAQTGHHDLVDIGEKIYQDLEATLLSEVSAKSTDADKIGPMVVRISFFCEGMKFRLISPGPVMGILAILTERHVIGHHKALARCLLTALNTAGRFLARHPVAQHKFEQLLHVSSKSIRSVGGEMEIQLGAVISSCLEILRNEQNREGADTVATYKHQHRKKHKSYEEQYLRHLVDTKLSESCIDFIVRKFLALDWDSFEYQNMAFNILRKASHVSFQNIPFLATIVRRLSDSGIDYLEIYIVDNLIEKFRQSIENDFWSTESAQKKFSDVYYFVELFNVGIVQESTLFYVLYMICLHNLSNESIYEYSRIRIIVALLEPFVHLVKKHKASSRNTLGRLRFFLYHFYILIHSKAQPFPIELNFSIGEIFDCLRKVCASVNFHLQKFPDSLPKAQELLDEVLSRVSTKSVTLSKDPVNSYRYFFLNTQAKEEIHPINEKCVDFSGIEEKEVEYERSAAEDLEVGISGVQVTSNSEVDISKDVESQLAQVDKEDSPSEELAEMSTGPLRSAQNSAEALEFDKLLKDMTKESFSTIRQQNTLKAMSGRRVATSQSLHLKNLRKVRETESSNQAVDAIDSPGGTVSVAVAIRNKAKQNCDSTVGTQNDQKAKGQTRIDFRVLHIPHDTNIATQQQLNIQEKRRERDEFRRTTQSMVSAMDHEPNVV